MKRMRVLIGCETSGRVRDRFLARGHDAHSCDILPSKAPGPHIMANLLHILADGWDLMIAHPPCQYLASSGLHWNGRIEGRQDETEKALSFVRTLMDAPIARIAIENPRGCIGSRIRPSDQRIQPFQYGEPESKETHLWLKNLPRLRPTSFAQGRIIDDGRPQLGLFGNGVERWNNQTDSGQNRLPETADRWEKRSLTYHGIADAMADQWGAL